MDAHCIKSMAAAPNTPASGHGRGALTFSSSSMLQIMWAQVVKISTARERVRILKLIIQRTVFRTRYTDSSMTQACIYR